MLSGISGPTPAAFTLRVSSGPATVFSRKQEVALNSSMNGIHSFWLYWTAARSGFDQLVGTFSLGRQDKHTFSPPFVVTTCRTLTVHGIECLGRGPFSQFPSQGPDTSTKLAGPVRINRRWVWTGSTWIKVPPVLQFVPIPTKTVQHNPRITVVFWGAQWLYYHRIMAQLLAFYSRLRGSAYNAALAQYNNAGNNPTLVGAWIDPAPPTRLKRWQDLLLWLSPEVERISRLTRISLNPSSQVIVVLPPGFHSGFVALGLGGHDVVATKADYESGIPGFPHGLVSYLLWAPDAGVAAAGDTFTMSASHEWAESVTDPNPPYGFNDVFRGEIADMCHNAVTKHLRLIGPVTRSGLTLARFYSGKAKACIAPPLP